MTTGQTVKDVIKSDLGLEIRAVALNNEAIKISVENLDKASRDVFVKLLRDEEDHVDCWKPAKPDQRS